MLDFFNAFVPQLLATLVGAFAGVWGVRFGFQLQRKAAQADSVDNAVEGVLNRLTGFAEEATTFIDYHQTYRVRMANSAVPPSPPRKPVGFSVSIAFEILSIRTHGNEREEVKFMTDIWADILHSPNHPEASNAAGTLAGLVSNWRKGTLNDMAAQAAMVRALIDIH